MDASSIGKWIAVLGIGTFLIGILIWAAAKWGLPIGKLPGDIHVQGERTTFSFPITTSIVLSLLLTLVLNFILWLFRK